MTLSSNSSCQNNSPNTEVYTTDNNTSGLNSIMAFQLSLASLTGTISQSLSEQADYASDSAQSILDKMAKKAKRQQRKAHRQKRRNHHAFGRLLGSTAKEMVGVMATTVVASSFAIAQTKAQEQALSKCKNYLKTNGEDIVTNKDLGTVIQVTSIALSVLMILSSAFTGPIGVTAALLMMALVTQIPIGGKNAMMWAAEGITQLAIKCGASRNEARLIGDGTVMAAGIAAGGVGGAYMGTEVGAMTIGSVMGSMSGKLTMDSFRAAGNNSQMLEMIIQGALVVLSAAIAIGGAYASRVDLNEDVVTLAQKLLGPDSGILSTVSEEGVLVGLNRASMLLMFTNGLLTICLGMGQMINGEIREKIQDLQADISRLSNKTSQNQKFFDNIIGYMQKILESISEDLASGVQITEGMFSYTS